jgi:regulator of cell morphogenesis and NO signaling
VVAALAEHDRRVPASDEPRYAEMGMAELADHIEGRHHAYLRAELPRIAAWTEKLASVHGVAHPWLFELRDTFAGMRAELEAHMFKEERILFPMVRELEGSQEAPVFHCGSVRNPISMMEHEHDDTGAALARMRELSSGFTPPPDACNTFRATMAALEELERDLHVHIHKENSILFPKAAAREAELSVSTMA